MKKPWRMMNDRFLLGAVVMAASICTASPAFAATSTDSILPANSPGVLQIDTEKSSNDESGGDKGSAADGTYERAIVLDVKNISQRTKDGAQQLLSYDLEFLSGPLKGQTRTVSSDVSGNPGGIEPAKGDKVIVFLQPNPTGGEPIPYLESFDRRAAMYWLIVLFIGAMVLLAGWQGLKIACSILLSVLLIGLVLIPTFLKGVNPIPVAMFLVVILASISSVLSIGWNKKSFVTVVGTLGGVLVAYFISVVFAHWAHLSGLSSDEDRLFFDKNPLLSSQGLLFAGIMIAALGVVEDVAVSIASGVMEVRRANTRLGFKELFRSGMVIGRDHMGALANTLVFAYVGGSLSTLLLYTQYGGSWAKFINFDSIVDEVIRSLAGTIGLVFTVPITALLAAWFALRIKGQRNILRDATTWHGDHQHPV